MEQKSSREYATQADYADWIRETTRTRALEIAAALKEAFNDSIRKEEVDVIFFSDLTVQQLAKKIADFPLVLKPLLVATNIAARAIERDLGIKNLDTYDCRLTFESSLAIAGYIRPFLPDSLALPALVELDRVMFGDKEIRKIKGQWETAVVKTINKCANTVFKKAKFRHNDQSFELDAASKDDVGNVSCGVDVKRIEARRDIHKRADEIVNKAAHFKAVYTTGKFGAVIYYPFVSEHGNVRDRLASSYIDSIVFAGASEDSINVAVKLLLGKMGCLNK
jgi:hypothetical protein